LFDKFHEVDYIASIVFKFSANLKVDMDVKPTFLCIEFNIINESRLIDAKRSNSSSLYLNLSLMV